MNNNRGKTMKRLFNFVISRHRNTCIVILLLIIISSLSSVMGSIFIKSLIDDYITPYLNTVNPDFNPLLNAILKMVAIYAIGVIATYTFNKLLINVSQGSLKEIRDTMFEHMEQLPIRYFDTHNHGDIMSIYTNDTDTLRQMISQSIPQVIVSATTIICVFVSMLVMSIPLTIISVIMVCVMLGVSKYVTNRSGKYFFAQQTNLGKVNGFVEEMMEGQKVVKVFTHEEEAKIDFDKVNEELFESAYEANKYANILMPLIGNLGYVSYVLVAVVGGVLAINGYMDLTVGTLASFLQLNRSFNQPISQISQQINMVLMALAGAERIFALMDEEIEVDEGHVTLVDAKENEDGTLSPVNYRTGIWAWEHKRPDGSIEYVRLVGDVRFHDVTFGYNDNKTILYDMNLFAKPGEKLAFVGATGAGKTTITNLINRFYDIQSGKIRYDGINIGKIKFPAPKNIPNNILATNINSLNVRFFFMFHLPYTSEYYKYFSHYIYFVPMRQTPLLYIFYQEYIQCIIYTSDSPVLFKLSLIFLNIPAIPTIFLFSMIYLFYTFNETQTLRRTCFFTTPNSLLKHI